MNRIITLAYTAIVLVAVGVEVCLLNSLKPNKLQNNEEPKSTKQTKAQPNKKTAESAENIYLRQFLRKSFVHSTHRASNILGRTGHHV